MQNHDWIAGVLEDLLNYSQQNDLRELVALLTTAAVAAGGLVRTATAVPMVMQFEAGRA